MKLTPNRPDCTGVRGIARDLAAAGLGKLKPEQKITGVEGDYDCPVDIKLEFPEPRRATPARASPAATSAASRTAPRRPGCSSASRPSGLRPINALVDVTNYISLDRGRPLHVYDADKLKGAIRARLGKKGETFLGLDGKTHEVDETMCVIADDRAVLGFGGILGGEDTGCTPETKNILIECAYFDPLRTAATGRKAGVQSDARYRFERGVDPAFIQPGLDLATAMMLEVAGGKPSKARIAGAPPETKTVIDFSIRPGREARRHRAAREADPRNARGAGLRGRGQGRSREGDGAELAAGRPWRRRSRRGGRAHRRPRQGAVRADAALERRRAPGADGDAAARAARAARAGGPRAGGGHHLVVHHAQHGRRPSAAARTRWNWPIPSRAR